ncbi:hypothetical protein NFI96_010726 [Prochilodus magdalenae]|nr:hypothetical protein NFI96_010726 [Prochilodus magdalenae]
MPPSGHTLKPTRLLACAPTVGVFLRRERNLSLKEDLLSCFSVRHSARCTGPDWSPVVSSCVLYYPWFFNGPDPPQDHHRADTPTLLVHLVDGQSETIAHLLLHSAVLVILCDSVVSSSTGMSDPLTPQDPTHIQSTTHTTTPPPRPPQDPTEQV